MTLVERVILAAALVAAFVGLFLAVNEALSVDDGEAWQYVAQDQARLLKDCQTQATQTVQVLVAALEGIVDDLDAGEPAQESLIEARRVLGRQ